MYVYKHVPADPHTVTLAPIHKGFEYEVYERGVRGITARLSPRSEAKRRARAAALPVPGPDATARVAMRLPSGSVASGFAVFEAQVTASLPALTSDLGSPGFPVCRERQHECLGHEAINRHIT